MSSITAIHPTIRAVIHLEKWQRCLPSPKMAKRSWCVWRNCWNIINGLTAYDKLTWLCQPWFDNCKARVIWSCRKYFKNICHKANNKPKALFRIRKFLDLEQVQALAESYISSNFRYCPLISMFCATWVTILLLKPIAEQLGLYMIHKHDHMKSYWVIVSKRTTIRKISRI